MSEKIPRVLFVCTGNACRSQMAEAWMKHIHNGNYNVSSGGSTSHGIDPIAVMVMKESGIDISKQDSKKVTDILHKEYDVVITLCDTACNHLPEFPDKTRIIHKPFDDPPQVSSEMDNTENDVLTHYRRVRDEIKDFVINLPNFLEHES